MQNLRIEKLKNLSLVALLMAGAAFAACSSSSDEIIDKQPANPTAPKVYTLVIKASKGGEAKGDGATTRALTTGSSGINVCWNGEETIEVEQDGVNIGSATAKASEDGKTTITAKLTTAPDPEKDLNFYLCGSNRDYTGQVGLLTGTNSISENYDYAMDCLPAYSYTIVGDNVTPNNPSFYLEFNAVKQAIIKFTLKDKADNAAISPSALTVTDGTSTVELTSIPASTYTANGDGVLYVAFPATGSEETITLTARVGDNIYSYSKSGVEFALGTYYPITVKMNKILARVTDVNFILNGGYKEISEDDAAELADLCWKMGGGENNEKLYVLYGKEGDYDAYCVVYYGNQLWQTDLKNIYEMDGDNFWFVVCGPVTYTAPTLVSGTLTYNGSAQALVTPGSATGGKIYYSTGGGSWSDEVPAGTNAGTYTVYYEVVPNTGYTGVEPTLLGTITIEKADWTGGIVTVTENGGNYYASYSGPGSITKWEYSTNGGLDYTEDSSTSNQSNQYMNAKDWRVTIGYDTNHNQTTFTGSY